MSTNQRIAYLREAALVERAHLIPHRGSYSLGLHHHNCLMLLLVLCPGASKALMIAVSTDDVPERWVGDMPGTLKAGMPEELLAYLEERERKILAGLGLEQELTREERQWLRAVDKLEAYLWCLEQVATGNESVKPMRDKLASWLQGSEVPPAVTECMWTYDWSRSPDTIPEEWLRA